MFGRLARRGLSQGTSRFFSHRLAAVDASDILDDVTKFYSLIPEYRTEDIYLAATQSPLFDLGEVYDAGINDELCLYAVRFNGRQIDKVPDRFKPSIDKYLANVQNIIVRDFFDIERAQFVACYLTNSETAHNSIAIDPYAVPKLLECLLKLNTKKLNLVFLGHSGPTTENLAQHSSRDMLDLLIHFPQIHKITLMGCRTVQSARLNDEIKMIQHYHSAAMYKQNNTGLALVRKIPDHENGLALLRTMRVNKAFMMVGESTSPSKSKVIFIEMMQNDELHFSSIDISETWLDCVQRQLKNGKLFTFPRSESEKFILRDDNHPLTGDALEMLERARDGMDEFSMNHPRYRFNKTVYPFLASLGTDMNEYKKLDTSLMVKVVTTINHSDEVNREITVEAFPKGIFPDMDNKSIVASKMDVYSREYLPFFENRINYRLLAQDRRRSIKAMDDKKLDGETDLYSIQMRVTYPRQ